MDWNRVLKQIFWSPISWKEFGILFDISLFGPWILSSWAGIFYGSNPELKRVDKNLRMAAHRFITFRIIVTMCHFVTTKLVSYYVSETTKLDFTTLGSFADVFNDVPAGPEYSTDLSLTEMQHKLARLSIKNMAGQFIVRVVAMGEEDTELFHITPTAKHSNKVFTIQWSETVQKIVETME